MSLQAEPQQPVQVYPSNQPPSSHHSNGSFGSVFIVLAIILVISVVACFLGRLCNKRYNNHGSSQRPPKQHMHMPQIHNLHPDEGDVEFGVDKRMPPPIIRTKGHGHGPHGHGPHGHEPHGHGPHGHGTAGTGPQPHVIDNMKDFEMKPGHGGEHRAEPTLKHLVSCSFSIELTTTGRQPASLSRCSIIDLILVQDIASIIDVCAGISWVNKYSRSDE
ncbi:hypothetical protein CR513_33476, partial [Mucuna pruriens]